MRLDRRGLDEGRVRGLRRRLEVGVFVGIGAGGCSFTYVNNGRRAEGKGENLCITRYAAVTAEKDAGDEGLSVYGLKADFNVGLGICGGRVSVQSFNCRGQSRSPHSSMPCFKVSSRTAAPHSTSD